MSASKDQKRTNARVMKWREMLEKDIHSDKQLLVRRTRKGIPQCIRIKVWPEIVRVQKIVQKNPLTYSKILLKDSYDVYDINLDIPRTFSFQSQQVLRNSLFNVLKALSIQFPQIGYCQGMNFLSMRLLQILDDEIVFYIIADIIHKYKSIYDNLRNPGFVNRQNQVFSKLLQQKLPKIYQQLKSHYIQPVMYTPSWFLTLYSKFLSNQKFYRFFQCFLVQGYPVIFKTALALMKLKQKQFLQNSMQENLLFINDSNFYDQFSDDQFISTVFSFELLALQVSTIEKEYTFKNKQMMKKLEQSIQRSFTKKLSQPRITYEWTIDDYKKVEANLLDFQ